MEGNSGGPPKEAHRRISSVPPAAAQASKSASRFLLKRKKTPPMVELPPDLKRDHDSLLKILQEKGSSDKHIIAVHMADVAGSSIHEGELRKGTIKGKREPYIYHSRGVAMRVARGGCSDAAVCAALLHDTIEDTHKPGGTRNITPVTPEIIEAIFEGAPVAPAFAKRVSELVVRLTKPKFSEEKEWIFADDSRYYSMKDGYDDSLYDQRSDAQYQKLQDYGDMELLYIKLCDNLDNIESMVGIKDDQRQKNFRTMANKSLGLGKLVFTGAEFKSLISTLVMWGFRVPPTVEKAPPNDVLVHFPPRTHIDRETLYSHPDPAFAYISIYGSVYDAFLTGIVEIGFPPDLTINYRSELEKRLPPGLFCEQARSLVPKSFPVHEVIFRISGFDKAEPPSEAPLQEESGQFLIPGLAAPPRRKRSAAGVQPHRSIRKSSQLKEFTDILDENGNVVISLADSAFGPETIALGKRLQKEFGVTDARYDALQHALRAFFSEVLVPALEPLQTLVPPNPIDP